MPAVLQPAPTGRAKCRGCGTPIAKGELRLGDTMPSPFADDAEMTHWYHPLCSAYKRPDALLAALDQHTGPIEHRDVLTAEARRGIELRRLPRIDGAERAPTGRANCRACKEKIDKDHFRIRLVFFDAGRFDPGGFVHARCATGYFGTADVLARVAHFSRDLAAEDLAALGSALGSG
jgi:hypothetical protein